MANNGTTITAPVSVTDIMTVLAEQHTDINSLCTSVKINKWSWRKPFSIPYGPSRLLPLTEDDVCGCDAGFNIPEYTSLTAAWNNAIAMKDELWEYEKPSGGVNSPYVQGDFSGYDHAAANWFDATTERATAMKDIYASITWNDEGEALGRSLGLASLVEPAKDLVAVIGDTQAKFAIKIGILSDPGSIMPIHIAAADLDNGTYTVVPMLVDFNGTVSPGEVLSPSVAADRYSRWFPLPLTAYPAINIDKDSYYFDYFDGVSFDISGSVMTDNDDLTTIAATLTMQRAQNTAVDEPLQFSIDIYLPPVYENNGANNNKKIAQWNGTISKGETLTKALNASNLEFVALKDGVMPLRLEMTFWKSTEGVQSQQSKKTTVTLEY